MWRFLLIIHFLPQSFIPRQQSLEKIAPSICLRLCTLAGIWTDYYSSTVVLSRITSMCLFILVHFLTVIATWNFLISHSHYMEHVSEIQKFLIYFLNLDAVVLDSTQEISPTLIWQIKCIWISSMKFETMRMKFFKWSFRFVATTATWRHDFSPSTYRLEKHLL